MQRDLELLKEIQKNLEEIKEISKNGGDGIKSLKITVVESLESQAKILTRLCKEFPEIEDPIKA